MILERLKEYIDYKSISVSAFEKSIGMSNASFGKSLKSGGAIGTDKLENILRIYGDISPVWLLTGEGNMLISEGSNLGSTPIDTPSPPDQGVIMRLMDKIDERDKKIEELTEKLCAAEKELISVKAEAKIEALEKPLENQNENANNIKSQYEDFPPLLVDTFTPISSHGYIKPSSLASKPKKSSKKSSGLKT